jgi:hypothetical protein
MEQQNRADSIDTQTGIYIPRAFYQFVASMLAAVQNASIDATEPSLWDGFDEIHFSTSQGAHTLGNTLWYLLGRCFPYSNFDQFVFATLFGFVPFQLDFVHCTIGSAIAKATW